MKNQSWFNTKSLGTQKENNKESMREQQEIIEVKNKSRRNQKPITKETRMNQQGNKPMKKQSRIGNISIGKH